jgi:D-xylose 1-dehydrogenase (NADP+, D-xylono-1,5-lactone-forming)
MDKVKWGVLGCASFARRRAIPAMLQAPTVEVVAIASRDPARAEEFRAQFGIPKAYGSYEGLLAEPGLEAVYIPLPNSLHGEWMIRAAERGIHSLTEKPFSTDAAEALRVAEAAERHRVHIMEGFMWRFHGQHRRAREAVRSGVIGAVRLVRSAFTFRLERKPNVRFSRTLAGGSLWDVGCYPVSSARFYFEDEPARVYACGEFDPETGVDMRCSGLLEFRQGRAVFDCGFDLPRRCDLEIVGESGTISIPKPWLPDPEAEIRINDSVEKLPEQNQSVEEFEHLSRCIRTGEPCEFGPADAVRQMKVLDAVMCSIRSGRPEAV